MILYPEECKLSTPLILDTHAHLDDSKFDEDRAELIKQMQNNGVCNIITCGCDKASSQNALKLANQYDFIYAAVGIHPENLSPEDTAEDIKKLAKEPKCVAIGEIGLDYYWGQNRNEQMEIFESQILLAKELDLPIIVHDREAHEDTLNLLLMHKPKGVVHCFSGSLNSAKQILNIGMYIGVGGVITFKNAKKLPEIVEYLPDDRILLETDCPYLAPEPYRGKVCHSGMIYLTAQKIAELRKQNVYDVLNFTSNNAKKLFCIK